MPADHVAVDLLSDMALIVGLARHRSFTNAARELKIAVSSYSRRVAAFERQLGHRLIDRTTRRFALTEQGAAYVEVAGRILEDATRVFREFREESEALSGTLRIAIPAIARIEFDVSTIIRDCARSNASLAIGVDVVQEPVEYLSRHRDLVISTEVPADRSVIITRVGRIETGLFAAPGYLDEHGRPAHPADLKGHSLIGLAGDGGTWRLGNGSASVDVPVSGSVQANIVDYCAVLAGSGLGVACLPLTGRPQRDDAARLERVLPGWSGPAIPIFVATTSRLISARTRYFLEAVRRHYSQSAAPSAPEMGVTRATDPRTRTEPYPRRRQRRAGPSGKPLYAEPARA